MSQWFLSPASAHVAPIITAADHQLGRLAKRQQNLQSAPTTLGAGNEKTKLLSNTSSAGKRLPLKTFATHTETGLLKIYRADSQDCQQCTLKPTSVPNRRYATATMPPDYSDGL